jgi:hypothetical protein
MLHVGQGVVILSRTPVQIPEIDTESDLSALISYLDQIGYPTRVSQGDYDLGIQQFLHLPLHDR